MAQKVVTTLVDDLDGTEAVETVTFALEGRSYEIDLNSRNAAKLRSELGKYVKAGRHVPRKYRQQRTKTS